MLLILVVKTLKYAKIQKKYAKYSLIWRYYLDAANFGLFFPCISILSTFYSKVRIPINCEDYASSSNNTVVLI